jgi:subtilisin family serine protease
MHTYSTPGKSFFLSFLLVRITLVTLLFAPVWASAQVQQPDPSALRFALPAVKVNDLSVPARMITVDRLQAAKAYAGTVLVKTRSAQRPSKNATSFQSVSWNQTLAALSVSKINAMIPEGVAVNKEEHAFGIDRIFEVRFEPAVDVFEACRRIAENPDVEYVTPVYDRRTSLVPNDTRYASQYAMTKIQAAQAWDISTGSATMVIADVDSGVDFEHEDLAGNLWTNPGESGNDSKGKDKRTNGVDDDGNGCIDDYRGWDFVGSISPAEAALGTFRPDNDPKVRGTNIDASRNHGTGTTGCAAAVTNNAKGIASAGFNCKYLPIKCGSDQFGNAVLRGYEGIRYAVNLGAQIVNCSWGGEGSSPAEQDFINFATAKGSLIIAAAGNDSKSIDNFDQYPANYANVLVVGASDASDRRASFSNTGLRVDVWAPGDNILMTASNNLYVSESGTSFACPIVAGVAGLIRSLHPDWTPKMVMHQLRSTCDNVLVANQSARPQFYGRINAYKALLENSTLNPGTVPGLEISSVDLGGASEIKSTAPVASKLSLRNYLGRASNVTVTLAPQSTGLVFSKTSFTVPVVPAADSVLLDCTISTLAPTYFTQGSVDVLVTMTSGTYTNYQKITIPINITSPNTYSVYATTPSVTYAGGYAKSPVTFWAVGKTSTGKNCVMRGSVTDSARTDELTCVWGNSTQIAHVGTGTGVLLRTTNGGTGWARIPLTTIMSRMYSVNFFDASNGVLLGAPVSGVWSTAITTDAGVTWSKGATLPAPGASEISRSGAVCWNGDAGWMGTSTGRVLRTTDRGATWSESTVAAGAVVTQIAFANASLGYALTRPTGGTSETSTVYVTTNGGASWKASGATFPSAGAKPVYAYAPANSTQCVLVCSLSEVVMTTDSGKTFQPLLTENGLSATTGFGLTSGTSTVTLYILGKTIGVLKFPFVGGTAGTAELSADAEVRWDTVNIGSTLSKNVTIRNTGTAALSVSSAVITPGSGSTAGEFSISGTVAPLLPGESGTYSVAFAPSAEGSRTATMTVTSNGGTKSIALVGIGKTFINSVDESSALAAARVFPMPSRGSLTIECASLPDGVYDVELLGMTGRRVYSHRVEAHAAQMSITPDQLAPGLYAVRILSSGKILATTFFVNE